MTPEKFENAALFLRLGLPSTLIRHENGAFRKRSSNRLRFGVDGKHFENGAFRKWWRDDNHVLSLPESPSNTNPKWPVIVAFSNFSGVVWTGPKYLWQKDVCSGLFWVLYFISNHDYEVQWPPDHVQHCRSLWDEVVDAKKLPSSFSPK